MQNLQKIGVRILLPATSITLLFSIVLFFIGSTILNNLVERNFSQIVQTKTTSITANEKRIREDLIAQASLFSQEHAVLEAYKTAHQGNLKLPDDPQLELARQQLYNHFVSIEKGYRENQGDKSLRLHFHLAPAISLLRLWDKKQNKSEDLSSFRHSINAISADHKPVAGTEIGRGGFEIRGIVPVIDGNGKYLGSVESLSSFDPVVNDSISNDKEYIAVYMKKESLHLASQLQDSSKNPIIGNFVFVSSTNKQITDALLKPELLEEGLVGLKILRIKDFFTCVFPIKDFSGKQIGVMAYVADASDIYALMRKIKLGTITLCISLLIAIIAPLFFSVRSVTKPITRTIGMLKDIAKGEGDLTMRLDAKAKDEIGELSFWFNTFIEKLQGIIKRIAENSTQVNSSANQLSTIAKELSVGAADTSQRAANVATASEEMSANLNNVAAAMEESSTNTNMVASAAEQMSSTISEIAENAEKARNISSQAVTQARSASEKMVELGSAAQKIGTVTETITEISEQTNLLALNATIEAARAGEAGKGFAVVANEIKDLAKQTALATLNIKQQIEEVQRTTDLTVAEIENISGVIGNVNDIITTIASAVEEQTAATKEIANNISQASQGIQEVNENVSQSSTVAGSITEDIAKVNLAAAQISESSRQVQGSSADLQQRAAELNIIVGNFKI